jgi:hypothetical protein
MYFSTPTQQQQQQQQQERRQETEREMKRKEIEAQREAQRRRIRGTLMTGSSKDNPKGHRGMDPIALSASGAHLVQRTGLL